MIVDPTVIQLKNSFQSYCIIKINPDYIKLCWNRPQLFALLKQLLKSSSRRYIWVSGRYILVLTFVSQHKCRRETLRSAESAWWELKTCDSPESKILLIPKEKKTWDLSCWFLKEGWKREAGVCWVLLLSAERNGTDYREDDGFSGVGGFPVGC